MRKRQGGNNWAVMRTRTIKPKRVTARVREREFLDSEQSV